MGRGAAPRPEVHAVRGFRVEFTNGRPDISSAAVRERLGEALALIARYQPIRFAHLRQPKARRPWSGPTALNEGRHDAREGE